MSIRVSHLSATSALAVACLTLVPAAAGQTLEDRSLANRLPPVLRNACTPLPPEALTPGALAGVRCDPAATDGVTARYESFPNHLDAGNRYRGLLLTSPGGLRLDVGDCDTVRPSEGLWYLARYPRGRLACFTDGAGAATYVWTHVPSGIVAIASRADGNFAMLESWWSEAGPNGDVEARQNAIGGLFPDPYETRLLERTAPEVAETCVREKVARSRAVLQASVLCAGPPGARAGVAYRRFATKALTEAAYRRDLRGLPLPVRDTGNCGTPPWEGEWTLNGRVRGRIACAAARGNAHVVWFHRDQRLEGYAYRRGRDVLSVVRWWRRRG